jgi:hypothetical protein
MKIFYGNDRLAAERGIKQVLGDNYETIEADNLSRADMDTVFRGTSLFGDVRKILIKNLDENKECFNVLEQYIDTPHDIVIWLTNLDRRSVTYKALSKNKSVEIKEFKLPEVREKFYTFKIFDEAVAGHGEKALKMCAEVETTDDPYMTLGAFASSAYKKLEMRQRKAVEIIKILAKADLDMKRTGIDGWKLIKKALLEIAAL